MIGRHLSYIGYATHGTFFNRFQFGRKSCDGLSEGYIIGLEWVTQLKPLKEHINQSEVAKFDYRCRNLTR